jgi:hypothetical protein
VWQGGATHQVCELFVLGALLPCKGRGASIFVEGFIHSKGERTSARRLRPAGTTPPALMGRAARPVGAKAVVRIEVAVSPRPCMGCAVELVLLAHRTSRPPRRPTPVARSEGGGGGSAHPPVPFGLSPLITTRCRSSSSSRSCTPFATARLGTCGTACLLGRFVRTLPPAPPAGPGAAQIRGPEFPALAKGQRLHPAQLIELPLPRAPHQHPPPAQAPLATPNISSSRSTQPAAAAAGSGSRSAYRDLPLSPEAPLSSLPLLHTRHLRTVVIGVAAVRAHGC